MKRLKIKGLREVDRRADFDAIQRQPFFTIIRQFCEGFPYSNPKFLAVPGGTCPIESDSDMAPLDGLVLSRSSRSGDGVSCKRKTSFFCSMRQTQRAGVGADEEISAAVAGGLDNRSITGGSPAFAVNECNRERTVFGIYETAE
jgi:hypothetical protein